MWKIIEGIAGGVLGPLFDVIDKSVTDKDLANRLKAELHGRMIEQASREFESRRDIIVAEAQGGSWIQRNWRPLVMLMFAGIIFNNYVAAAYLPILGVPFVYIEVPQDMWELIKLGLGGYVVGRSAEKVAGAYLASKKDN